MTGPAFRIALAFIFAILFLGQGITAPFHNDEETRPAGIIVDIVDHQHWLIPVDLQNELTRKPPLFYWISALIAEARGGIVDEPGSRIVSLLAAAATAAVVIELASAHFGIAAGCLAYLFLLGTYGFASRAVLARTDMLFTFLLFAAYSAFYPLTTRQESSLRVLLVGALLGLAILTKGPLALALCFVGIGIYFAAIGRNPLRIATKRESWIVLGVAFVIAAIWYLPAFVWKPKLLQVQLIEENLGHFLPARLGGTGEAARPMYYMWLRFIGETLPLNFYLLAALPVALKQRGQGGMLLYQAGFLLGTVAFFTVSSAKRDDYILAALPSFAMVIAAPFAEDRNSRSARLANGASFVAAVSLLILAFGGLIATSYPGILRTISAGLNSSDTAYVNFVFTVVRHHLLRTSLTILVVAGASAMSVGFVAKRRGLVAALGVALAEIAAVSLWMGLFIPEFASQRTLKGFVLDARKIVGDHEVMIAGVPNYELSYYFGRGVPAAPKHLRTDSWPGNGGYLFVWNQDLDQIRANERLFEGSVVLVSDPTSGQHRMVLVSVNK